MKLATTYLGFKLRTPLVPSASPLSEKLDNIKRMEDAGASAVVFHSLFEEQLRPANHRIRRSSGNGGEFSSDALDDYSDEADFKVDPEAYVNHIAKAKEAVRIPIIGSLNGSTFSGCNDSRVSMAGSKSSRNFCNANPNKKSSVVTAYNDDKE
jgi:dihydroorotate dehydrogenase (fumarate)